MSLKVFQPYQNSTVVIKAGLGIQQSSREVLGPWGSKFAEKSEIPKFPKNVAQRKQQETNPLYTHLTCKPKQTIKAVSNCTFFCIERWVLSAVIKLIPLLYFIGLLNAIICTWYKKGMKETCAPVNARIVTHYLYNS